MAPVGGHGAGGEARAEAGGRSGNELQGGGMGWPKRARGVDCRGTETGARMEFVEEINAQLARITILERMEFLSELEVGHSSLALELVDDARRPTKRILLVASDISGLELHDFDRSTQLMCLRVEDVRRQQHDRVRYVIEDLEHRRIRLRCDGISLRQLAPISR
jgi:hypothetical protein